MLQFRSTSHNIKIIKPKGEQKPGKFDFIGPLPHGTKVILEIELPADQHHLIKDLEFRKNNMTNTWAAIS